MCHLGLGEQLRTVILPRKQLKEAFLLTMFKYEDCILICCTSCCLHNCNNILVIAQGLRA